MAEEYAGDTRIASAKRRPERGQLLAGVTTPIIPHAPLSLPSRTFPAAYAWYNAIRDEKRTAGAIALNSYRLMLRAQELYCAVALYGHTHVSEIEYAGGVQIVCPGSPSVPRRGRRKSFAKLEIENGSAVASIVAL